MSTLPFELKTPQASPFPGFPGCDQAAVASCLDMSAAEMLFPYSAMRLCFYQGSKVSLFSEIPTH